jgi:hypothetical protein
MEIIKSATTKRTIGAYLQGKQFVNAGGITDVFLIEIYDKRYQVSWP